MMLRLCLVLCVVSDWSIGAKILSKRQTQDFKDIDRFKRSPGHHHGPPGGHGPPGHRRHPGRGRGPPEFEPMPTDFDNGYGNEEPPPYGGPPGQDWPPPGPPPGPPPEFVPPGHRKHHHHHRPPHQGFDDFNHWHPPGPPPPPPFGPQSDYNRFGALNYLPPGGSVYPTSPTFDGWVTPGPPSNNQPTWSPSISEEYTGKDKDKKVISGYIDKNFPVILLDEENEIRK